MSLNFSIEMVTIVSVYTFIVLVGIGYFLSELGKMVR